MATTDKPQMTSETIIAVNAIIAVFRKNKVPEELIRKTIENYHLRHIRDGIRKE